MAKRCENCKKKVNLMCFECKCKYKNLCINCKLPETHACQAMNIFKEEAKNTLKKNNPVIVSDKLIKI